MVPMRVRSWRSGLSMNLRAKENAKRAFSPLTPALSPRRGERERMLGLIKFEWSSGGNSTTMGCDNEAEAMALGYGGIDCCSSFRVCLASPKLPRSARDYVSRKQRASQGLARSRIYL